MCDILQTQGQTLLDCAPVLMSTLLTDSEYSPTTHSLTNVNYNATTSNTATQEEMGTPLMLL